LLDKILEAAQANPGKERSLTSVRNTPFDSKKQAGKQSVILLAAENYLK